MATGCFRFDRFLLDRDERRLDRDGEPVDLSGRYLDALALLVREHGKLVSKGRFLAEVWNGVPVTDEALTQCIRTLRRQLGDDAADPRFIATVPKHGYRFIAAVESVDAAASGRTTPPPSAAPQPLGDWRRVLSVGAAGTIGGGVAGVLGGLVYGLGGVVQPSQPAIGATSVLLVLLCVNALIGLAGGAGVAFGIAAATAARRGGWWSIVGGATGGLIVGAFAKLLGLDAFDLLFGRSPGDITGAAEGTLLGGAVGAGAWIARRIHGSAALRGGAAAIAGGGAGLAITLCGGRLMAGSLDLLAHRLPDSRLRLDRLGALFGERGFGPISRGVTGCLEGALFAACVVGAMIAAQRALDRAERG